MNENVSRMIDNPDLVADIRDPIEHARADAMECVRLRLLWAVAAGGDDGICAQCAVAVIRFAEGDGRHWTDRDLRGLHRRLCTAHGLPHGRFERAVQSLKLTLFLPV